MEQAQITELVKSFIKAANKAFNDSDGGMSFFQHAHEREIDCIIFAGSTRVPGGYTRRELTGDEYLVLAETYATIAERAGLQDALKPSIPSQLRTAEAGLKLLEKAPAFATLCITPKL